MALKRIIPCLLYDGSGLVKTIRFKNPSYVGDPINAIKIFNDKEVDELILLDIRASREKRPPHFEQIADMAGEAFMPFAYGGGVKEYEHFARLYKSGVEKVVINSLIQQNPEVIRQVIRDFGSQAVVGSVDYYRTLLGKTKPFSYANLKIAFGLEDYIKFLTEDIGVGEIMLTNVDREGTWTGYDLTLLEKLTSQCPVPVIASGGCGKTEDIQSVLEKANVSGAAIGSMAVYSKKGMGVLINFPTRQQVLQE